MQLHPAIQKLNELLNNPNQRPPQKINFCLRDFFSLSYPNRIGGIQKEIFEALKNQINNNGNNVFLSESLKESIKLLYAASSKDKFFYPHSLEVSSPKEIQSGIIDFIKFMSEKCQEIDGSDHLSNGILFQKIILENKSLWWPPVLQAIKCDTNDPNHDFIYFSFGSIGGQDFNNILGRRGNAITQLSRTIGILKKAPIEVIDHPAFFNGFIEKIEPTFLSFPLILSMRPSDNISNLDEFFSEISDNEYDLKTSFFLFNAIPFKKEYAELWTAHIQKSIPLQNILKKMVAITKTLSKGASDSSNASEYANHFEYALLCSNLESGKIYNKKKSL